MPVNGIQLAIGQRWKTRGGDEVEIIYNDGHNTYPWLLSNKNSVTNQGQVWEFQEDDRNLITLIQDEHGFIPWNGGECPVGEDVKVEVMFRDKYTHPACAGDYYWEHKGKQGDIIAYRVVKQEVKPAEVDAEEEDQPKYTIDEVLQAFALLTGRYAYATDEVATVKKYLAKTQDPDYKLYLELKAKFE